MLKVTQYEAETKYDDGLYNSRSELSALLGDRSGCGVGRYLVVAILRAESREQRDLSRDGDWRLAYSMDINSWGGRRKLLQRGGVVNVGGEDRRGP